MSIFISGIDGLDDFPVIGEKILHKRDFRKFGRVYMLGFEFSFDWRVVLFVGSINIKMSNDFTKGINLFFSVHE